MNWSWVGFFHLHGLRESCCRLQLFQPMPGSISLFGGIGLMLAFVLVQGMLLSKYIEEEKK